jgi:hypothetical protein
MIARDTEGARRNLQNAELTISVETEQLPLFSPPGRQPRRQTHQCLGGELRRFSAIDDGRGDVGCQPGKTQEGIEVGCRHALLASDIMHAQPGVLDQTLLFDINMKPPRRLKNKSAVRLVPIHRELLRLGFLQYVAQRQSAGDERIFPNLEPGGADGRLAACRTETLRLNAEGDFAVVGFRLALDRTLIPV